MLTNTLRKGYLFYTGSFFVSTTIPFNIATHSINYSECLSVLYEILGIWIFINPSSLALPPEEFLKWILRQAVTKKSSDTRYGNSKLQQLHKQPRYREVKELRQFPQYTHTICTHL